LTIKPHHHQSIEQYELSHHIHEYLREICSLVPGPLKHPVLLFSTSLKTKISNFY